MFNLTASETRSAIETCDRMYRATFRSEPYVLSDDEYDTYSSDLVSDLVLNAYCAKNNISIEDADCDYIDSLIDLAEDEFYSQYPDFKLNRGIKVVELCNYKGESEGLALYDLVKNSPVFIDKNNSFFQV